VVVRMRLEMSRMQIGMILMMKIVRMGIRVMMLLVLMVKTMERY
jgi:hypothetical protein